MLKMIHVMSISLRVIWRFRLRSSLILLSAMLSVGGVVASVNYASGGRQQVLNQIRLLGTNVLIVTPQQSRTISGRARTGSIVTTLNEQDYALIGRDVPHLTRSSAVSTASFTLRAGDLSKNSSVVGCESDYIRVKNWKVEEGNFFSSAEDRRATRVAILGHTVAHDLFDNAPAVGARLLINRVPFEVIGVMSERGQGLDVTNEDNQIYVPLRTAMHRLSSIDYYSGLILEVDRWENIDETVRSLNEVLRQRHRVSEKLPEDYKIQNQKELIETQEASSQRLSFLVRWIGISGLIVSGLGILAISWIAIKERTVELGTRRAIGATASVIFFQILFEALAVSLLGGIGGLAIAWQSSKLISEWISLPFVFDWTNAESVFAISVCLNLIFALLPGQKGCPDKSNRCPEVRIGVVFCKLAKKHCPTRWIEFTGSRMQCKRSTS